MFSIVQNAVAAAPQLTHAERSSWAAYMQDLPWTMLKFAAVTRSAHRLRDISLALLMKLQALPTFSQPAYAQEHLMAFVSSVAFHFMWECLCVLWWGQRGACGEWSFRWKKSSCVWMSLPTGWQVKYKGGF